MKAGILIGYLKNEINEDVLVRTAEAFGINHIFVIGKHRKYFKSKGADEHVTFIEFRTVKEFIDYCKMNNHSIVCLENGIGATDINKVKKYPRNPIFVTGHECLGINEELLYNSKICVNISQGNGYVRCLNTCVACSIIINDWFQKTCIK